MLTFLIRKILKNKWMMVSLLLGNILLAGIVSGIPLYAQATMRRLLLKQADAFLADEGVYPGLVELTVAINLQSAEAIQNEIYKYRDLAGGIPGRFGLFSSWWLTRLGVHSMSIKGFPPPQPRIRSC